MKFEQRLQRGGPDDAALRERRQDGDFVVIGVAEATTLVQVDDEAVVTENLVADKLFQNKENLNMCFIHYLTNKNAEEVR